MSIDVIQWILKHSPATKVDRLVLLALGWRANDDGSGCWPSVATLARDARCSQRAVQYALRRLEGSGQITRDGTGPKGTTSWSVVIGGGANDAGGVQFSSEGGASDDTEGVQGLAPEPSLEQSTEPSNGFPGLVDQVFDYWRSKMNKNGTTKLTAGRRRCVGARLREGYSREQLERAIDGCAKSDFHMGSNDSGRPYNDLTLICRNGEKVEQFIELAERPRTVRPDGKAARISRNLAHLEEVRKQLEAEGR